LTPSIHFAGVADIYIGTTDLRRALCRKHQIAQQRRDSRFDSFYHDAKVNNNNKDVYSVLVLIGVDMNVTVVVVLRRFVGMNPSVCLQLEPTSN
jgi:hypothetical protein